MDDDLVVVDAAAGAEGGAEGLEHRGEVGGCGVEAGDDAAGLAPALFAADAWGLVLREDDLAGGVARASADVGGVGAGERLAADLAGDGSLERRAVEEAGHGGCYCDPLRAGGGGGAVARSCSMSWLIHAGLGRVMVVVKVGPELARTNSMSVQMPRSEPERRRAGPPESPCMLGVLVR